MDGNQKWGKLKDINIYIMKAFKFYELKNEKMTPVVFALMFFIGFISSVPSPNKINREFVILTILSAALIHLTSSVYLTAYIKELKGMEYDIQKCVMLVIARSFRVVGAFVLYMLAAATGSIFLLAPGIIVYLMFIFNTCYIVDLGEGIIGAFTASKRITKGYKKYIFAIILVFSLITYIPFMILVMGFARNNITASFVSAFLGAIINLMQQRLVALMYVDLEYSKDISVDKAE